MSFLNSAINLLDEIDTSSQKKTWCQEYSVYSRDIGSGEFKNLLLEFQHKAYELCLVITNYYQIIELYKIDEDLINKAEADWLATLPAQCVLACIAWHFRRDHFCEGSLINKSIASGAMLRMLQRLKEFYPGPYIGTTLETLYHFDCAGVPSLPGIYRILAPEGMVIEFEETAHNVSAPLYSAQNLRHKYLTCKDKRILYIGKASRKQGLRQCLRKYVKYGWNESTNHKGGRAIWQIKDFGMLLVEYEICTDWEEKGHFLLKSFQNDNNSYPLANWRQ